ncbi:MAG: tetratricopeptide repeat protein [Melioribacteraceae bacterium]|nr:tetratricopeptide repeat protein [Melioribacteraceae bacterium]
MRIFYIYIILLIVLAGCSSSQEITDVSNNSSQNYSDSLSASNRAMDYFIRGNIAEMKGNTAEAILEYQEALNVKESAGIHFALAKNYFRIDKLSKALKHSRRSVELDSLNNEYMMLLAGIYSSARLTDSSAYAYERILKNDPQNFQAQFSLAQLYEPDQPLKALGIYENLINKTGPEWSILVRIAELNERMGNIEKTISTIEELLELNPSNLQLAKLLIESLLKVGNYEKSLQYTDDAITLFPDDLNLIEYKAKALVELKQWEEGTKEYLKIVSSDKLPYDAKVRIASAYLNESSKDSTLLPYVKSVLNTISRDSTDWQLRLLQAETALKENDDSAAVGYFKAAAAEAAWNSQLFQRLGILLFDSQRYNEAIEELSPIVNKFPDDFVINIILGLSLSQVNKHAEAENYLYKAVNLNPGDLMALHAYGYTLQQLDKKYDAIKYLENAIILDPDNIQVMGTLGLVYESMQNFSKSDSIYKAALSIDSTDALILNNFAYSLAERDTALQRAFEMSEKALNADPENSSYLDTFGWIHYKLGNYSDAKKYIQKAIEAEPDNATLLDHLADVYYKTGDKEKAIELWQKALSLNSKLDKVKQKLEQEMM